MFSAILKQKKNQAYPNHAYHSDHCCFLALEENSCFKDQKREEKERYPQCYSDTQNQRHHKKENHRPISLMHRFKILNKMLTN